MPNFYIFITTLSKNDNKQTKQQNNQKNGSYYSAEFIFPDFPGQNELFSLTNLFTQNTNVGFQLLAITLETRAANL